MANYKDACQSIRDYIEEKQLKAGEKLPSEAELSKMLGVSRLTLREALNSLKTEGRVYAIQGKGTFVSCEMDNIENVMNYNLGVTEMIRANGHVPGTASFQKILAQADRQIADRLGVREGMDVLVCSRVRLADDMPVAFTTDYMSNRIAQEFLGNMDENISIYDFIEKKCGISIGVCRTEMIPAKADKKLAELLNIPKETLLMKFKLILNDVFGEPLVYAEEYFRADAFNFVVLRTRK